MNWITSIEGIVTMVFGGVGLGTIIANVITSIKNVSSGRKILGLNTALNSAEKLLKESVETNKELAVVNQEQEETIAKMELAKLEENETMKLVLTSLSYIVSASGGIDDVTKIQLITEMDKAKNNITKKYEELKELTLLKAEEVKRQLEEKKEELLDATAETAINFLDGAREKVEEVINKHARR